MTFENDVARELPFLRRYARMLTGSQAAGDAAVRETLQAMIAAPDEFRTDIPVRNELYRVFHKLWTDASLRSIDLSTAVIGALPHKARKALLLTTIEGFAEDETAFILSIEESEVRTCVAEARDAISSMLSSRVLVIEDEAIIALHLKQLLVDMGNDVAAVARTASEAVEAADQVQPELILADINLADGSSGIDAVDEILQKIDVPVIFITAFPEKLLTGERPEPAYVIAKPFSPDHVAATVMQALLVSRETSMDTEDA
ncbi:response regulator [Erythrobacter sp. KY5]|uniref:response regulator n=1 Tax=Erythrobacter sp. KY5 TaxID=2011159 RepID=UPI000DBF0CC8|nr:response regulator [Erythrobacter sp. KY5]AWW74279.1 response regulator [Erythrobacter sp. KY5]